MSKKQESFFRKFFKNIGENLKKFSKRHKKEIKTTKRITKKTIIIGGIIAVIALAIFFLIGLKIRFILQEDIMVELTPHHPLINLSNNSSEAINFTLKTYNFFTCESACTIELFDIKKNKTIAEKKYQFKDNSEKIFSYEFESPERGEGQRLYTLNLKCKNIESNFCLTNEEYKFTSTLITLDYKLEKDEKKIKQEIRKNLPEILRKTSDALLAKKKADTLLAKLPQNSYEKGIFSKIFNNNSKRIEILKSQALRLRELWNKKEYAALKRQYEPKIMGNLENLTSEFSEMSYETKEIIKAHNENLLRLKNISIKKLNLTKEFYLNNSNPVNNNKLLELDTIAKSLLKIHEQLSKDNYSIRKLNTQLQNLTKRLKTGFQRNEKIIEKGDLHARAAQKIAEFKDINITLDKREPCKTVDTYIDLFEKENSDAVKKRSEYKFSKNLTLQKTLETADKRLMRKAYDNTTAIRLNFTNTSLNKSELISLAVINLTGFEDYTGNFCFAKNFSFIPENINNLVKKNLTLLEFMNINETIPPIMIHFSQDINKNHPECCSFNECRPCIENSSQINKTPILFIHGHSFNDANSPQYTMNVFGKIERKLQNQGVINAGELFLSEQQDFARGVWGKQGRKLAVKSSYYYISFYDIGSYSFKTQKSERIENYAIRLKDIINVLKKRYGSEKIDIVAHSMGGLVTREYVQLFGGDDVNKMITVNTPHKGIQGNVENLCSVFGAARECEDMSKGSIFLKRLNSAQLPENIDAHSIRSVGCIMDNKTIGDGIVTKKNAYWDEAKNYIIHGNCTDSFNTDLHSKALDPDIYPETYRIITEILLK
ncbi:MAG: alpha/beta fold hydrolase [Nanobdellota archaeon]